MKNKMEIIGDIYCAGIYGMRCRNSNNYLYIGSSIEINDALSRHLYFLKRGLYEDTNKTILQFKYDYDDLVFEVIKTSCFDKVNEMNQTEKDNLQKELSVLEKFYINLYKKTVCNSQKSVTKHSSNRDEFTTVKRQNANKGELNPNVKYTEEQVCNILYFKENGFKAKEIKEIMNNEFYININVPYISSIGNTKWIHISPKYADWMDVYIKEKEAESTAIDATSTICTSANVQA